MSSTTIDGRGVVTGGGSGLAVSQDAGNVGFGPFALPVSALTANTTLVIPGVYTLSASTAGAGVDGGLVVVMPLAASVPGAHFIFSAASAHFHDLTCSQETGGTKAFCHLVPLNATGSFLTGSSLGSRLEMRAVVGSSVLLVSDGKNFLVTAGSGTLGLFSP